MRKLLVSAMLLMGMCSVASAQDYNMVVKFKDGTQAVYSDESVDTIFFKNTADLPAMMLHQSQMGSQKANLMSFSIDMEADKKIEDGVFTTSTAPCVPGTTVMLYKWNHHPNDDMIIFLDCHGSMLKAVKDGIGDGGWSILTATAPVNTSAVKFRYLEPTGREGETQACFAIDRSQVYSLFNAIANTKTKTIGFIGDSTGQGLQDAVDNNMFNDECVVYKGSEGGENVLATAARQGSIPMVVMPFTIPASSVARWSNTTGSVVESGNDPEIKLASLHTYEAIDPNGNPVIQVDNTAYFAPTHPFYVTLKGVKGYIYSVGEYKRNAQNVLVVDNSKMHTYFHRTEPGTRNIVLSDTCHTVSDKAELWASVNNVVMVGTNGGYQLFDDNRYIYKNVVTEDQMAKNLVSVLKKMSDYCYGNLLVVGMFCQCNGGYNKTFYEAYDKYCEKTFGKKFLNARKYLIDSAWKELGITLTTEDVDNMNKGMAPWSLFGNGVGKPSGDPHLTNAANKALANQIAKRIQEIGWVKKDPNLNVLK